MTPDQAAEFVTRLAAIDQHVKGLGIALCLMTAWVLILCLVAELRK